MIYTTIPCYDTKHTMMQYERSHYLILMGTNDVANLRILVRQRFTLAAETWNASNPNNDDKVTTAEFQEFLLHDYGIDHLVSILLWRNVDSEDKGYVEFPRYIALGFGSVEDNMYIYIYIYIFMYASIHICVYIYIYNIHIYVYI